VTKDELGSGASRISHPLRHRGDIGTYRGHGPYNPPDILYSVESSLFEPSGLSLPWIVSAWFPEPVLGRCAAAHRSSSASEMGFLSSHSGMGSDNPRGGVIPLSEAAVEVLGRSWRPSSRSGGHSFG